MDSYNSPSSEQSSVMSRKETREMEERSLKHTSEDGNIEIYQYFLCKYPILLSNYY